jgi:DNA-binding NtrC family response regulator
VLDDRKKILILDDEPRIRAIYGRMLAESGVIVRLAATPEEAIEILIREKIDMVLLDINMPVVNGKTVFEIIQEYDPSLKVIVSSVYPLHVQKIMIPNAYDYHDKSHGPSILLEKIYSLI